MKNFQEEAGKIADLRNDIGFIDSIEKSIKILKETPFALWGAGAEGVEIAELCVAAGVPPIGFIDKNKTCKETHTGLQIIKPTALLNEYKDINIIISSFSYHNEILADILNLIIEKSRILPRLNIWKLAIYYSRKSNEKNLANHRYYNHITALTKMIEDPNSFEFISAEETYNNLGDEKSKKVFFDFLRFSVLADPVSPDPINSQYFDPVCVLEKDEVVVDCGAFTGDTAKTFFEKTNNNYRHYYAFEPDSENYKKLASYLLNKENSTAVNTGVWSETTTLYFNSGYSGSSFILSTGDIKIDTVSIDDYFSKIPDIPTLIKMDIEGSEVNALEGAEKTIKNHKPKLAICVYHKPDDLSVIPALIKKINNHYKFYLRHYTDTINELVLYAV